MNRRNPETTIEMDNPSHEKEIGYKPDGQWEDLSVEVKSETHGFRNLRAGLLGLAYWLTAHPKNRGLLVLVGSRITEKRLQSEFSLARQVFNPDIVSRIALAYGKDGHYSNLPEDLKDDFRRWLDQLVLEQSQSHKAKSRDSFHVILELLVHQWLLNQGPMTTDWLMKTAGCSYPTVAGALRQLAPCLHRHSDRRVELRYFPKDEWAHLLAVSNRVRSTIRFADVSGNPRSPNMHLTRLEKLKPQNVALGGTLGARHYDPNLNLIGTPLLNLSIHCTGKQPDLRFVEKLDPALKPVENPFSPIHLVVHVVHRTAPLFQPNPDGIPWADPVECLLDLQEMHLESQANEFVRALRSKNQGTST